MARFILSLLLLVLTGVASATAIAQAEETLYALTAGLNTSVNLLIIDTNTGAATIVGSVGSINAPSGLANRGSKLYTWDMDTNRIVELDPATAQPVAFIDIGIPDSVEEGEGALSFRSDGTGFLASAILGFFNFGSGTLYSFDIDAPSSTLITDQMTSVSGGGLHAMDFDPSDNLFGISQLLSDFYQIDATTGAATLLGSFVQIGGTVFGGMTYRADGALFAVGFDVARGVGPKIYLLNPEEGSFTEIGPSTGIPFAIAGLSFLGEEPEPPTITQCLAPPSGLVAWWPLDETGGTTTADIFNGNPGTLVNGPVYTTGKVANALSFDGVDGFVEGADSDNLKQSNLTLDLWVKPTTSGTNFSLAGKFDNPTGLSGDERGYLIQLLSSGRVRYGLRTSNNFIIVLDSDPQTLPLNQFSHLALTYDGAFVKGYINGVEVVSTPATGTIIHNSLPLLVGARFQTAPTIVQHFSGLIDEVEIFDRALSSAEILSIYNADSAGKSKEPPTITVTAVTGNVSSDCLGPLQGVTVDLDHPNGDMFTTATDANGDFVFADVPTSGSDANISIVVPLGYSAVSPVDGQAIGPLDEQPVAFTLACLDPTGTARSMGYWKHQANVFLKGKGKAQESQVDMETNFPQAIFSHFFENQLNSIQVADVTFLAGPSPINLTTIRSILTVNKGGTMLDRAKQQYLALLLNLASGKLLTSSIVSADGATASQALQQVADDINDGDPSNDETAKDISDTINNAQLVSAGVIDLGIETIAYSRPFQINRLATVLHGAAPNPFLSNTIIRFSLKESGEARVVVYDITGRLVRSVFDQWAEAGPYEVTWNGVNDQGTRVASGIYYIRMVAKDYEATKRAVFVR